MSVSESFQQDGEEPDKMPEWLLEEKRDFKEHLDKDGDKILNTDEIQEWVAPSEGKFRVEEVTHLFKHADLNQVSSASHSVFKESRLCNNGLVNLGKMMFSGLVHCLHHMVHCTEITFSGASKLNIYNKYFPVALAIVYVPHGILFGCPKFLSNTIVVVSSIVILK